MWKEAPNMFASKCILFLAFVSLSTQLTTVPDSIRSRCRIDLNTGYYQKASQESTFTSNPHPVSRFYRPTHRQKWRGLFLGIELGQEDEVPSCSGRRRALAAGFASWISSPAGCAADNEHSVEGDTFFRRQTDQLSYTFQPPLEFGTTPSNKPLKTHLDEVNFISPSRKGYQFGITVDPVRINSLKDFGSPEEVAAKVVLSEVNRDGVFDVTLMEDPIVVDGGRAYQLNYLSVGKRGRKRYVARFAIVNQKLYALTAQCLEDEYKSVQQDLLRSVNSFAVGV